MSVPPPSSPAAAPGWYDDGSDESIQRYWNGSSWTDHTAPRGAAPSPSPMKQGISGKTKGWIIGGSVVVGLILMSSIASAVGGTRDDKVAAVSPTPVAAAPVVQDPEPAFSPTTTPDLELVDATFFRKSAERDLSDFGKDLDDMDVTLNEGGFWRLLSNSVELSFNLGQLQALDAPVNVVGEWTLGVATLEGHVTSIGDAISAGDDALTRAAIAAARAHVAALKAIALTAA